MALNIADIRDAVARKIAQQWSASPANIYAYPPEAPEPACVLIRLSNGEQAVDYHGTFGVQGMVSVNLEIEVRVLGWDIDAAKRLDQILSTGTQGSMFDALAADNYALDTIDPVSVRIVSASQPVRVMPSDGAITYMSTRFVLLAYTARG